MSFSTLANSPWVLLPFLHGCFHLKHTQRQKQTNKTKKYKIPPKLLRKTLDSFFFLRQKNEVSLMRWQVKVDGRAFSS